MKTRVVEPGAEGTDQLHIGIAAAQWNRSITDKLVTGALTHLEKRGVGETTVLWVPGSLELPIATAALAENGCDAVIAVGVVIKGETDHYQLVSEGASSGIQQVAITFGIPVTNAVLAVHDVRLAIERAGEGSENKGDEAASAAVDMALALRAL